MKPEEVQAEAARRAEAAGAANADIAEASLVETERPTIERLRRWAFIDPDPLEVIYSTRALGAPITAAKRAVARMLRQYHNELTSQTSRYNVHLLAYVEALEKRVGELEAELAKLHGK